MDRNELIDEIFFSMKDMQMDLLKARGYNRSSTRKARLKLVALEKLGKRFREITVKEEKSN